MNPNVDKVKQKNKWMNILLDPPIQVAFMVILVTATEHQATQCLVDNLDIQYQHLVTQRHPHHQAIHRLLQHLTTQYQL